MTAAEGLALAVDVGGTTIKAALVDHAGTVVAAEQRPTPQGHRALETVAEVGRTLLAQQSDAPVVGAGVVVPGLVDREAGVATYSANIGWRDLELVRSLGAEWGLPVRIGNDVAAGGVAEHRLGAGVGTQDLAFVPIGTGIAASIVSGGHLLTGHRGETAEIGHLAVRPGIRCACGRDGCLEAVASAAAIARRYAALSGNDVTGAHDVAERLSTDTVARQVWQDAVEALADALGILSLVVSPALVVIGGGLSRAGELLLAPLRVALRERATVVPPGDVTASVLGDRGGVIGAALLARDGWEPEVMTAVALAGRLVTTSGILDQGVLEVRPDGTIGYVGPASGWSGPAPEPVDTVAPGFVDIHCHGGGSHTVTSGDPSEVAAVATHHLSRGTTTMLASLVSAPAPELVAAIEAIASVVAAGSPVVGCHVEGPFLDPAHRGAHDSAHLRVPGADELATWLAAGVDGAGRPTVRMVTLAPELPGALAAAELLERSGVVVGLGHTGADAAGFGEALRSLRNPLVTHLFNGMEPLHHRRPGPVAASLDALARGATRVELIADGVHVADETVHLVFAVDPGRHVVLVSDAMVAAGMPDGDFELGSVRVRVADGRALTRAEPPALAGGTAHAADLVRRCVVHAGVDPVAAVAAATSTPAALLGLDDRGSLTTGLRADLVVLDHDWRVHQVMWGGDWVR